MRTKFPEFYNRFKVQADRKKKKKLFLEGKVPLDLKNSFIIKRHVPIFSKRPEKSFFFSKYRKQANFFKFDGGIRIIVPI